MMTAVLAISPSRHDRTTAREEEPDKPLTGRLMVRLPPELHRELYAEAKKEGKSARRAARTKAFERRSFRFKTGFPA